MTTENKRFILLTIRGQELYFEKVKYFRDKWRAPVTEIQNEALSYGHLLALPEFYNLMKRVISSMFIETTKLEKFDRSAFIYFHNRDGASVVRMDSKKYGGPKILLEKVELPSLDYDTLVEDDKFMARIGQITLKHLFDTPMVFEK